MKTLFCSLLLVVSVSSAHAFSIPCRTLSALSGEDYEDLNAQVLLFGGIDSECKIGKDQFIRMGIFGFGPGIRQGFGSRLRLTCPAMKKETLRQKSKSVLGGDPDANIVTAYGPKASLGAGLSVDLGFAYGSAGPCILTGTGLGLGADLSGVKIVLYHGGGIQSQRQIDSKLEQYFSF